MRQASLKFFDKGYAAYFYAHKRHFCIAVRDRILGGYKTLILPKSNQICLNIAQL